MENLTSNEGPNETAAETLPGWRQRAQIPALAGACVLLALAGWIAWPHWIALAQPASSGYFLGAAQPAPIDFSGLTIPKESIHRGGPPKDGIPALTNPACVSPQGAPSMNDTDTVIGIAIGGQAKAYPLKILDFHEIVNDTIAGVPVAVTYCPLCDSSVVFDRRLDRTTKEFGVSGLLHKSNVLMFDRDKPGSEGLWTQMGAVGVSGHGANRPLRRLPMEVTTWRDWRSRHAESLVLSVATGYPRRYDRSIYASYFQSDQLMFSPGPIDPRLPAKTPVLGIVAGGLARAYPFPPGGKQQTIEEGLGVEPFTLVADLSVPTMRIERAGPGVEWCYAYWFAWSAFNPETELHVW